MFDENFSFTTSRTPSLDLSTSTMSTSDASRSVSPCSPTTSYAPPTFSVNDLAAHLANSRLRQDSQICYNSCEAYAAADDDAGWQLEPLSADEAQCRVSTYRARTVLPQRPHSPCRRHHRQSQTRLLCSVAHHKDIARLVSRMVDCREQCSVSTAAAFGHVEAADDADEDEHEDEGYNSSDAAPFTGARSNATATRPRLDYRRSSDLRSSGVACVNKAIRLRRNHRRIRSSETEA